jgi:hypothetical protein
MAYSPEVVSYAAARGINESELPLIVDGCSGAPFLWAVAHAGMSGAWCCEIHDIDYQLGGSEAERRDADRRLRICIADAGEFPPGVHGWSLHRWRRVRAWVMWGCVRVFGWPWWNYATD